MAVLSFNHFNIRAPLPLMEAVKDFYCDVVGLHVGERPDFGFAGYWLYLGDLPVLHLMEWTDAHEDALDTPSHLDHVAFSCEDIAAFAEKLDAQGVDYRRKDYALPDGRAFSQLFVRDPTGTGVELNFVA